MDTNRAHMAVKLLSWAFLAYVCFGQNCTGPTYACAMHQTAAQLSVIPLPSPIPSIGNLVGANKTWTAPGYNTKILRCTDSQTSTDVNGLHSWEVTDSGGSSDIQWNANGRLLRIVYMTEGTTRIVAFDPIAFTCSKQIPGSQAPTGNVWSNRDPNTDYSLKGTVVSKRTFDYTNPLQAPSSSTYFDFAVACPSLPPAASIRWHSPMWITIDDSVFAVAFSDQGGQDTAEWLALYQPSTNGCQTWNTFTGTIVGHGFGLSGTPSTFHPFTLHDIEMGFGGVLHLAVGNQCAGCPPGSGFLFKAGTLTANWIGVDFGGHNNVGYTKYINSVNGINYVVRSWDNPTVVTKVDVANVKLPLPAETHVSWKDDDVLDTYPFLVGTSSQNQPQPLTITSPLEQENVLVNFDGTFTRVSPTMVSGVTNAYNFRTANAIGSLSKQGYYAWSSDWEGTLGNMDGVTGACVLGALQPAGCRSDVFIVIPQ